ncbi:MAG: hypothetical protein HY244_10115 [Rhizobiales bacterium]|nr:hypothetical protein [Hyphomicrobiales bacterium]
MHEAQTYRQFAADCARMAQKLNAEDKEILMKIAEAWELRAQEAERQFENGKKKL